MLVNKVRFHTQSNWKKGKPIKATYLVIQSITKGIGTDSALFPPPLFEAQDLIVVAEDGRDHCDKSDAEQRENDEQNLSLIQKLPIADAPLMPIANVGLIGAVRLPNRNSKIPFNGLANDGLWIT